MKYKKGLVIIGSALFVLVAIGVYFYYKEPADVATLRADISIAATDLIKEFDTDEAAATNRYRDKILAISGSVISVEKDTSGLATVFLGNETAFSNITCSFYRKDSPGALQLKPGDTVTIKGMFIGKLSDIVLNQCSIEK